MINHKTIGISIPAYNESGFITKTIQSIPNYVDQIVCVDDCSQDNTLKEMRACQKKDKRLTIIHNQKNHGVGYSVKIGLQKCLELKVDYAVIAPGDNQCDLSLIKNFVDICESKSVDVCRGNRFLNRDEIKRMPKLRWFGNSVYSFISKFISGYYSLFDFQSSFGVYRSETLTKLNFDAVRDDYLLENSLWTELNIVNARIREISVPVRYQGEISNINYFDFIRKSLSYFTYAILHRLWQKYFILLHPLGLFLISGSLLFFWGLFFGLYVAINSLGSKTATTATIMLSVVPFILGFQLLLQAIVLDIQNEPK